MGTQSKQVKTKTKLSGTAWVGTLTTAGIKRLTHKVYSLPPDNKLKFTFACPPDHSNQDEGLHIWERKNGCERWEHFISMKEGIEVRTTETFNEPPDIILEACTLERFLDIAFLTEKPVKVTICDGAKPAIKWEQFLPTCDF